MNCPMCNNIVPMKRNRCERCGEDIGAYKNLIMLSNRYYNEGLAKAKVRDLSGAIIVLNISLEKNKKNTDARNLLGLVYYETGETVSALTEWVISKHFQPEENDADEYINSMQSNPTKLDGLNQTIKKYNLALSQAKQGNEDLSIIQLKKVVSLNPKFVKGLQLLALLYIKNKEYDKAMKQLQKALKIDISNTTTLQYMKEVEELTGINRSSQGEKGMDAKDSKNISADKPLFVGSSYKEDKPNIWPIISLFIGAVIGALIIFFLVVPTTNRSNTNLMVQLKNEHADALNRKDYSIKELEDEKLVLQGEIDSLKATMSNQEVKEYDEAMFDSLFEAASIYSEELEKGRDIDYMRIADSLLKVDPEMLTRDGALALYNKMKEVAFKPASKDKYDEAHALYTARKYEEAEKIFLEAYELDKENAYTVYFLGRTYHQMGNTEKALEYYNMVIDDFSDSSRVRDAKAKVNELE